MHIAFDLPADTITKMCVNGNNACGQGQKVRCLLKHTCLEFRQLPLLMLISKLSSRGNDSRSFFHKLQIVSSALAPCLCKNDLLSFHLDDGSETLYLQPAPCQCGFDPVPTLVLVYHLLTACRPHITVYVGRLAVSPGLIPWQAVQLGSTAPRGEQSANALTKRRTQISGRARAASCRSSSELFLVMML